MNKNIKEEYGVDWAKIILIAITIGIISYSVWNSMEKEKTIEDYKNNTVLLESGILDLKANNTALLSEIDTWSEKYSAQDTKLSECVTEKGTLNSGIASTKVSLSSCINEKNANYLEKIICQDNLSLMDGWRANYTNLTNSYSSLQAQYAQLSANQSQNPQLISCMSSYSSVATSLNQTLSNLNQTIFNYAKSKCCLTNMTIANYTLSNNLVTCNGTLAVNC